MPQWGGSINPKVYARYQQANAAGQGSQFLASNPRFARKWGVLSSGGSEVGDPMLSSEAVTGGATNAANAGNALANIIAPELNQDGALGRLSENAGYAGQGQTGLNYASDLMANAGQMSPEMRDSLDRMKAGLGGYTTPEEEALKTQALAGIQNQYNAGMRAAQGYNIGANLRGGIAANRFAPVMNQALQQQGILSANVLQQEMAERARRLTEYSNTANTYNQNMFNNKVAANANYGSTLAAERLNAQNVEKYNNDQQAKELAGRIAARGAGASMYTDERAYRTDRSNLDMLLKNERNNLSNIMRIL